jgi:Tfp pilus assembly protein FimT
VADAYIILAHELIHADRYARGVAVRKTTNEGVKSVPIDEEYTYKKMVYDYVNKVKVLSFATITGKASKDELLTVGIIKSDTFNNIKEITENMIRKEHGLWLRGTY